MSKEAITEFEAGMRLDKAVAAAYPEYSRSSIEKLIVSGDILVNDEPKQTRYKLKATDVITVNLEPLQRPASNIQLPILYEDENVVVINKPVGILAHSKGAFNKEGTVATWLKNHCGVIPVKTGISKIKDPRVKPEDDKKRAQDDKHGVSDGNFWDSNRAGIVHRLDRGTSGAMIVAKNKETEKHLQKQFANRNVKKTYLAVIAGELPENEGLIDIPIERNPKKPATFRAGINGKSAQTEFHVISSNVERSDQISPQGRNDKVYSLVELKPITGRTHQLRVHLSYLKHPIVGDEFYGGEEASRLMLHAQKLEVTLPSSERRVFEAPVPPEFENYR